MGTGTLRLLSSGALALALWVTSAGQPADGTGSWEERAAKANQLYVAGEWGAAVPLLEALVREAQGFEAGDARLAILLANLGTAYREVGRGQEAARCLERAVRMRMADGRPTDAGTATILNQLAIVYTETGQYAKAEGAIGQVREILRAMDVSPIAIAGSADLTQSRILMGRGYVGEAEALVRGALARAVGRRGPVLAETVLLWNQLGCILTAMKHWRDAEAAFGGAVEGSRQLFGERHPNTAKAMLNAAAARRRAGRPEDAEKMAREAGELIEERIGTGHPAFGAALLERAASLRMLKRGKEAKVLERRAFSIRAGWEAANHVGAAVDVGVLALRGPY